MARCPTKQEHTPLHGSAEILCNGMDVTVMCTWITCARGYGMHMDVGSILMHLPNDLRLSQK